MTEQQESGQAVNSDQASGQVQGQEQQGVQPTSPQPSITDELRAVIREEARRAAQSDKDRAVARNERRIEEIYELVKKGMTPQQIEDKFLLDELRAERTGSSQPASQQAAPTNAAANGASTPVDFTAIYQAVGLESTDNDVIRLTVQHAANPDRLKSALVDLKQRRMSQPPANPATVASPSGGGVASTNIQLEQKTAEMERLLSDPVRNHKRLTELKKEIAGLS